jgi:biopolymer transport protein ExbB/TolQ
MELDLVEIWNNMGNLVRGVVVVLTIEALACITVVFDRLFMLWSSERKSRAFAKKAGPLLEVNDHAAALAVAKEHRGSHLASFIEVGLGVFLERRGQGHTVEKAADLTKRALERKGENLSESLSRGMNVLASTGSTAPFIGLLGTVLGILNAFKLIAAEGSGGIGTIGSAIGEALIVTGYGLMVAIPAVLLFNWLSGRISHYEAGLANAGSELVDRLEGSLPGAASEVTELAEQEDTDPARAKTREPAPKNGTASAVPVNGARAVA